MIQLEHLSKTYGNKKALKDLSITFEDGKIIGLIGHNGAGKSTTLKILTSVIQQTSGSVTVNGLDLNTHRFDIKKQIGYVSDTPDLFLDFTANELWTLIAAAYELPKDSIEARIEELSTLFNLQDHRYETIQSFSHGMRQKVFVIAALLPNPSVWILDEPLTGLDPQAAFDLKEMMRQHAAAGNTVLFSTHVLEVAENLCDQIAILKEGTLLFDGTLTELKALHPDKTLETIYLEMAGRQSDSAIALDGTEAAVATHPNKEG